jgi:peptidyl-prolyl cis-trans isomerase A (cyclophilin A)
MSENLTMKKYKIKKMQKIARKEKRESFRLKIGLLIIILIIAGAIGLYLMRPTDTPIESSPDIPAKNRIAVIETNFGIMEFELHEDEAPITTKNFIDLSKNGFYDGLIFHRVVKGFVIQGGDPTGTGTGGSGETIPDEISPYLKHDSLGVLSMANSGPNTGSSQFFITLAPATHLDGKHAIFGRLIKGEDVLMAIGSVEVDQNDRPIEDITMRIKIVER